MNYSLETIDTQKNSNIFFTISIFCMAILLHQSQVIFGINISFADMFFTIIFTVLVVNNQLVIPVTQFIYAVVVSVVVLLTSVIYIPSKFMYTPDPIGILSDYAKLVAIVIYFIFGYNLSRIAQMDDVIKWYSYFGIFIGGIGVVFTALNIHAFSQILFYGGVRYRGLMIDPNYFAVLQITALVYLTREKTIKRRYKWAAGFVVVLSVLISGSKTGIITFSSYMFFRFFEYVFIQRKHALAVVGQLFGVVILIAAVPIIYSYLQNLVSVLGANIPSFSRVELLFTNFRGAFSENGSGRNITWNVAIQIIQLSPIIGIGVGTYRHIAIEMFHESDISHNTFLQLSAEWGIPLAFLFFSYVLFILGKATMKTNTQGYDRNLILRDIVIILLIGSMAISLNNARILWLVFGALVSSLDREQIRKKTRGKHA